MLLQDVRASLAESPTEDENFYRRGDWSRLISHSSAKTIEKCIDLALLSRFKC